MSNQSPANNQQEYTQCVDNIPLRMTSLNFFMTYKSINQSNILL